MAEGSWVVGHGQESGATVGRGQGPKPCFLFGYAICVMSLKPRAMHHQPLTKLLLVNLGFCMCYIYWPEFVILPGLYTETNTPWLNKTIGRKLTTWSVDHCLKHWSAISQLSCLVKTYVFLSSPCFYEGISKNVSKWKGHLFLWNRLVWLAIVRRCWPAYWSACWPDIFIC